MSTRKQAREAMATLLEAALVGTGKPCQAVYAYRKGDFEGQSPVVVVTSAGTLRERLTFQGSRPRYRLSVQSFVLYDDRDSDWDEQDAEDALDEIEELIAGVVDDNQVSTHWDSLDYDGESDALNQDVVVGGEEYRREIISIVAGSK